MSRSVVVYAVGRPGLARFARSSIVDAAVIEDEDEVDAQPPGSLWLCAPEDAPRVGERRPDGEVLVIRVPAPPPWPQIAHELRGPIGVVQGAMEELGGGDGSRDDPMIRLALRGCRQLAHLAESWEALSDDGIRPVTQPAQGLLDHAGRTLGEIEPRRARRVRLDGGGFDLTTDRRRFHLGLVRLLAHAVRATSEPILVAAVSPRELSVRCATDLHLPRDATRPAPDLWQRSSRLAAALALLAPLTECWEPDGGDVRWRLRTFESGAPAALG